MKNFLGIIVLGLLWCSVSYSNPNNPTNEWLEDKTVNQLTQEYGYKLFSVTPSGSSTTLYTLINRKIIVTCVVASGNPKIKFYCFLP
tara:strand:+ start:647 stop:907 length:261 start_codon:yes stop_codon:yes gene_type:complete